MSGLTTHVLDLTHGRPAAAVAVSLAVRLGDGDWAARAASHTDTDGRARLLETGLLTAGAWRLAFEIGPYFRASGTAEDDPAFLETVLIEFRVTDPATHYHVPLLVSPFGYSTYRGS